MMEDKYTVTKEDWDLYNQSREPDSDVECPNWFKKVIYYVKSLTEKKIIIFSVEDSPLNGITERGSDLIDTYVDGKYAKNNFELIRTISAEKLDDYELEKDVEFLEPFVKDGYEIKRIY